MTATRARFLLAGGAGGAAILAAPSLARAADTVRCGVANTISDAPLFIGEARGYFKEQNLAVELTPFDSAAKMVAPMAAGQLDAGAGGPSAALYNGVERGINIKIVADKGLCSPGYGFNPVMVRKALMDSGRVKSLKDLKGLTLATTAPGNSAEGTIYEALKKGGLQWGDVKIVYMGFPEMLGAFQNGAIDAGIVSEPIASESIKQGFARKLIATDEYYPNQQIAVLLYGQDFIAKRNDVAKRFMLGYVKSLRFYFEALKDGKFAGPNADAVITILAQYTALKDRATYAIMTPAGVNPDGGVNMASLLHDLNVYKELGEVKGAVTPEQVVDSSFVDNAVKVLGRYKR